MSFNFIQENFVIGSNNFDVSPNFIFYRRGFRLGGGGSTPTWQDIVISGVGALTLVNAKANGLNYVKLFGKCEQPEVDVISTCTCDGKCTRTGAASMTNPSTLTINNGVLGADSSGNLTVTGTRETLTDALGNTATVKNLFAFPSGAYHDTQNIITGNITRRLKVLVLTGQENWSSAAAGSVKRYRMSLSVNPKLDGSSSRGHIVSTHFNSLGGSAAQTVGGAFTYSGNFLYVIPSQDLTTVSAFETWLSEQLTAGTPVIFMYPRSADATESTTAQTNLVRPPVTVTGSIDNLTVNITTTESITPTSTNPIPIWCNNGELKVKNKYLPSAYQEVDGLIGDGEAYIDLDTGLNQNDIIEIKFSISSATAKEGIFGGRTNASTNNIAVAFANNNNSEIVADFNNSNYANYRLQQSLTPDIVYTLSISKNKRAIYNGDTLIAENSTVCNDTITVSNCFLYMIAGSPAYQDRFTGTIYSCKIRNKRNLIPCRRLSDSVLGMYDTVSGTFLTNAGSGSFTAGADVVNDYELYIDGTKETVKDSLNNTATAENLLSVDEYSDVQNVLTGEITSNVMTYVVDGTEEWEKYRANNGYSCFRILSGLGLRSKARIGISNYLPYYNVVTTALDRECFTVGSNMNTFYITLADEDMTLTEFTSWLKGLRTAGRPFIVVLPRYTSVASTVTPQTLTTKKGTNVIEITQASIDGLSLEVSYKGGVTVTVEEVENANLDNQVTVTIT